MWWKKYGPLLGQIYVQVSYGAMFLITRVALTHGMSHYTYVIYRQIIAVLAVAPFAYFLERSNRPALKLKNLGQIFLLALLGITISQNLYYAGLSYTSTTLGTTMNNLNPAITFIMAFLLRLEEVDVRSMRGQAMIIGTVLSVGGAMVMTLIKGPALMDQSCCSIHEQQQPIDLLLSVSDIKLPKLAEEGHWILGAFLLATGAWAWSAFLIYQAWTIEDYPSQLTLSALVCFMGTLQSLVVGLFFEPSAWRLNWDSQLLVFAYSGVCSAFGLFVQMWCVKEKGPIFAAAFNPLSTVLVAILETLLLHVQLHWGSLVGMLMVIGGLYCVIWGKASNGEVRRKDGAEQKIDNEADLSSREPLLVESSVQVNI